jgi:acyl carrier protein
MNRGTAKSTVAEDRRQVVRELVREMSPSPASGVGPKTNLIAELGYDSLGLIELVATLEDALSLAPIDNDELAAMERVGDLERIVAVARPRPARPEEGSP